MSGKGSSPRPFSVSLEEFDNNFDNIFRKNKMTPRVQEDASQVGRCGCGRSPTGFCIGWHSFTEEELAEAQRQWDIAEYTKQAQSIWNDSCTSVRSDPPVDSEGGEI